jgi:hypothetical protein
MLSFMRTKAIFSLLLLLLTGAGTVLACSCLPDPPPAEKLSQSSAVFAGSVITTTEKNGRRYYEFSLTEVFKGELKKGAVVSSSGNSAACGAYFAEGGHYLVYANGPIDRLVTSLCSGNQDVTKKAGIQELETLRAIQAKAGAKSSGP